jgi:hypothetical protein
MTETPETPEVDLKELETYVTRLQAGSAILYSLLNEVYALHTDGDDVCTQCEKPTPCPTAQIILSTMVEEKPAE